MSIWQVLGKWATEFIKEKWKSNATAFMSRTCEWISSSKQTSAPVKVTLTRLNHTGLTFNDGVTEMSEKARERCQWRGRRHQKPGVKPRASFMIQLLYYLTRKAQVMDEVLVALKLNSSTSYCLIGCIRISSSDARDQIWLCLDYIFLNFFFIKKLL